MFFFGSKSRAYLGELLKSKPAARAQLRGDKTQPSLSGEVSFYPVNGGVLVLTEVHGLPISGDNCAGRFFGFHIHEGGSCTGSEADPFSDAKGHFNPGNCPHPQHAGDLPPLFGGKGNAWGAFLANRFTIDEIIGRTVILHSDPDDFTSQPAGNAGSRLACGVIRKL